VRPNFALDANGKNIDPNLPADRLTTGRYFNTEAFVQPIYSFGNVGRNTMTGAKLINLDATVARTFRLTDKYKLQFRTEFFNLANHSNYGSDRTNREWPDFWDRAKPIAAAADTNGSEGDLLKVVVPAQGRIGLRSRNEHHHSK